MGEEKGEDRGGEGGSGWGDISEHSAEALFGAFLFSRFSSLFFTSH